jgi:UDP-3-O-[3-hydroxymyristoyl] glucosamine N-acyltransferase
MSGKLFFTLDLLESFFLERELSVIGNLSMAKNIVSIKPIGMATNVDAAFCRFDGIQGLEYIQNTNAGLIFIPKSLRKKVVGIKSIMIFCEHPRLELLRFISRFWSESESDQSGVDNPRINNSASIGNDVVIGPFSVIGAGVVIGAGSRIGSNCHIENTFIGSNAKIGSSVTIGGTGFGFENDPVSGETLDFPHIGSVHIGNDVFIGSSTCIDRGSIGDTVIGSGTKIDNLVHIAHNVIVGENCRIIALTIVGGSVNIGDRSWISPGAAIRDWRNIGKDALVGIGAVVTKDVEAHTVVVGNPAKPIQKSTDRYK